MVKNSHFGGPDGEGVALIEGREKRIAFKKTFTDTRTLGFTRDLHI